MVITVEMLYQLPAGEFAVMFKKHQAQLPLRSEVTFTPPFEKFQLESADQLLLWNDLIYLAKIGRKEGLKVRFELLLWAVKI